MLDKETAQAALTRLGALTRERHIDLRLVIYGGTVMMLAYDTRPGTKDIDGIFFPKAEVQPLIHQVARELGLNDDWLNDDVKMWVGENETDALVPFEQVERASGVPARRPTAKYLLAMKARAARLPLPGQKGDYADLVFLLRHTNTRTTEAVDKLVERYFLQDCLPDAKRAVVEAALQDAFPPENPR